MSHCCVNGNHFSEGEKENRTPATHSAHAGCDKSVSATRKNASDSETVEHVNLGIVSESLAVTDTFSDENSEGFSVRRHIYGTDTLALPVNQSENMSENNSANDVDLNKVFTPVADVNARGVRVYYKRTSFLHWNVCGLQSKLSDRDFINYIVSFDFICLVETFVENIDSSLFSNNTVYCKPAVKLSKQGRHSGGILCLIRNSLVPFVRKLNSDNDLFIFFLLETALFGKTKDVVYMCVRMSCRRVPLTTMCLRLKEVLSYWRDVCLILSLDDGCVILCSDLNGRTSNRFPATSSIINPLRTPYMYVETEPISRRSEDKIFFC